MIMAIICELLYINRAARSADRTFARWPVAVCSQFVQALSIMTACVPYLKPFFASLESGMIRTDDAKRLESRSIRTDRYNNPIVPKKTLTSSLLSSARRSKREEWTELPSTTKDSKGSRGSDVHGADAIPWDTESQASHSRITDHPAPV